MNFDEIANSLVMNFQNRFSVYCSVLSTVDGKYHPNIEISEALKSAVLIERERCKAAYIKRRPIEYKGIWLFEEVMKEIDSGD